MAKDTRLTKNRLSGYNKPKRTPNHPTKSHVVLAKEGDKVKLIRFGQQGADTKPPRKNESQADKDKRKSCLLYTSPSPRDGLLSRMPSSA